MKQFDGPFGIPVIYQRMPDMVKSVSMQWSMFTGAADDESAGQHGLYHWLEHVPFRGTKKFPNGEVDTKGWTTRYCANIGAFTSMLRTSFEADVPLSVWKKALEVITDLVAQPLIRQEDVCAERDIIRQEIANSMSQPGKWAFSRLADLLYKGHAFGHPILGTEKTLDMMDSSTLMNAWKSGYDRRRLALFFAGNVPIEELMVELHKLSHVLPDHGLIERRCPAHFGEPPEWKAGRYVEEETSFSSTYVCMIFPMNKGGHLETFNNANLLTDLITSGSTSSPLYKILRGERKLVYAANCDARFLPGGSYLGIFAQTKKANVDALVTAIRDVVSDPGLSSPGWIDDVVEGSSNFFKMRSISPRKFRQVIASRYDNTGGLVINDSDYEWAMRWYSPDSVASLLNQLDLNRAQTIVFKGTS